MLVGATYAGSGDDVRLSRSSDLTVPGLFLQAIAVETILSGFQVRDAGGWPALAGIALTAAAAAAAMLRIARLSSAFLIVFLVLIAYGAAAFLLFVTTRSILPVAAPVATIAAVVLIAAGVRYKSSRIPLS